MARPEGGSVALRFPVQLPAPVLSGSSATYPEVYPGVDLVVTVAPATVSEVLVVKSAAAAVNPALRTVNLTLETTGLQVTTGAGGTLRATTPAGDIALETTTPYLWDSRTDGKSGGTPSATDPGGAALVAISATSTTPTSVTGRSAAAAVASGTQTSTIALRPDPAQMTGAGVQYPLYIDPQLDMGKNHTLTVRNPGSTMYNPGDWMRVGKCTWAGCNPFYTARSFFELDSTPLTAPQSTAQVTDAHVGAYEVWNANNCAAQPVNLWSAGVTNAGTVWGGPLTSVISTVSSNAGDSCSGSPANWVDFFGPNVTGYLQAAANNKWPTIHFGLTAPDESNAYQWKKFSTNPFMRVSFQYPPTVPTLSISTATSCNNTLVVGTNSPTLTAQASTVGPNADPLTYLFGTWNATSTVDSYRTPTGSASGALVQHQLGLPDGFYGSHVTAYAGQTGYGTQSGDLYYTVHATTPGVPTVFSRDYPQGGWGPAQGTSGTFTLGANGSSYVAGFAYGIDTSPPTLSASDCAYDRVVSSNGTQVAGYSTGTITTPPTLPLGQHTLTVSSFTDSHLTGPTTTYDFYVSRPTGAASARYEAESLTWSDLPSTASTHYVEANNMFSGGSAVHMLPTTFTPGGMLDGPPPSIAATITIPATADYALSMVMTAAPNYGQAQFYIDDKQVLNADGQPVTYDGYNPTPTLRHALLGGYHFAQGSTHTIRVVAVGRNTAAIDWTSPSGAHDHGYSIGVDSIAAAAVNNVSAASFEDAMNNNGITETDGALDTDQTGKAQPANLELSPASTSLSRTSLTSAGMPTGTPFTLTDTLGTTTFTIPRQHVTADGVLVDNVIAIGQKIPVPTTTRSVDLLVLASCHALPIGSQGTAVAGTFSYDNPDASPTDELAPGVPDYIWDTPPTTWPRVQNSATITHAAALDHVDLSSDVPSSAYTPELYHVRYTVNSDYLAGGALPTAFTLPSYGTNFTLNTCSAQTASLHILAMSTVG